MNRRIIFIIAGILLIVVTGIRAQKPGMYTDGRHLYTSAGEKLILKGFNAMIVYWDIHGEINFPEIEKTGANSVRIFWKLADPHPEPADLDKVLGNSLKHNMIPIICLWDATGNWSKLQECVDYWCSPEIVLILQKYEKNLIVNIANEAGDKAVGDEVFIAAYTDAIKRMRRAGIRTPLMIDADQWGRNANSVLNTGNQLLDIDPDRNLIFSWHLWDSANHGTGTREEIDRIIETAVERNICFVVGEFGPCERCENCASTRINWEYLIEKAFKHEIGYMPWVWRWTDCHSCVTNIPGKFGDWANEPWGESISVGHRYSIKNTAEKPKGMITPVDQ